MAGVDCLQAMIFLAFLLLTAVHAQRASNKEEYLLAGGKQKQGISRRSPSMTSEFVPVVYRSLALEEMMSREPFETCSGCRCCFKSNSSNCVQTRCCYGIKCNLPGKPFGTCGFLPLTCGCGPNNCAHSPSSSNSSSTHVVV